MPPSSLCRRLNVRMHSGSNAQIFTKSRFRDLNSRNQAMGHIRENRKFGALCRPYFDLAIGR